MADDVSLRFRLLGEDAGASRAFSKVGDASNRLNTKMVAVGAAIGSLAASGVMALGGLAVGAVKTGLETASAMQQAQIGFATLLGSAQKAQQFVGELSKFAAATPFEFPGLVNSSRTLLGVGVAAKDVIPMLTDFGDAAGALAIDQDAFQRIMMATSQAISAGKFQAGDLNQIMNNGLPVWTLLSKAMHKSVPELRDLASHGKLLASDVLPALQAQMHKDYGGAMAKQSQTLSGLWSTFQDTLAQGMAQVLQPLIPMLQTALPQAMTALQQVFTALSASITFIGEHSALFGSLAAGIGTLVAALTVWAAVTKTVAAAQAVLNVVLTANPIGVVVVAIAALAAGLIYAYTHSETFRAVVLSAWGAVQGFVLSAVNAIKAAWDGLIAALGAVITWFRQLPGRIMAGVASLPGLFLALLRGMFDLAAYAVGFSLGMMVNLFVVWPGKIGAAIASLPGIILHWITTAGVQGVQAFAAFHASLIARAVSLAAQMAAWAQDMVGRVVAFLATLPGRAVAAIRALPGLIKGVFSSAGTWLLDVGARIVHGLVQGIERAASAAVDAVRNLGSRLVSGMKDALSIMSPSRVFADEVGRWIPPGLVMGIQATMPQVQDALRILPPRSVGAASPGIVTAGMGGTGGGVTVQLNLQSGFIGSPAQLATALSDVMQRAKGQGLNLSFT